jgi:4-hydroxythreonine-4-phosphate dehydrogenase
MKPRIGVLLGDPNGIGPELALKLLAVEEVRARADIVVIGDEHVFRAGEKIARVSVPIAVTGDIAEASFGAGETVFLDMKAIEAHEVTPGEATAAGGRSAYESLKAAIALAKSGAIDGFCFAPLNKHALKLGGSPHADEHVLFAELLGHTGAYCEHNVLCDPKGDPRGDLWTVRVTSHIPLADVASQVTTERILAITRLARDTLTGAGIEAPRIAVCALNPHAGDGGMFGREEIDVIAPAVALAKADGIAADGPYPADTIFRRARDGAWDAVVTMYHDQGQIAMKLMGFERGITVSGGLPVPIATPASGTAFDITGQGIGNAEGLRQAFEMVCRMAETRRAAAGT